MTSEPKEIAMVRAWYCIRTQPKHEHIAAANLMRNLKLEVFNPRLRLQRSTQRGVVRVVEPLFPSYLFVRFALEEQADAVRYVNGVSSLVRFGDKIPPVPDAVVEELQECFEADEPMSVEDRITPGAEVSVAEGAFRGFSAVVLRVMPSRQRVQILLDFLGRASLAEVDRKSLILENSSFAESLPSLAAAEAGTKAGLA